LPPTHKDRAGAAGSCGAFSPVLTSRLLVLDGHASNPWSRTSWRLAWSDVSEGFAGWRLWSSLGWSDIRQRYRRSVIGPFWLTLSMAILILALGIIYATLFHMPIAEYLPFLTLGYLIWGLISNLVTDACTVFSSAAPFLKHSRIPKSVFVYRAVWRNLLMTGHNAVVYVAVALIFGVAPSWWALTVPLALLVVAANGVWMGLLLGMVAARFRDVPQLVSNLLQVLFFVTPILFKRESLGQHAALINLNPLAHFVEVVRDPLLGGVPELHSWLVVIASTLIGWGLTYLAFVRLRARIVYWI
jgi:ABC-type polysaccharide/polyol phosphate export permease